MAHDGPVSLARISPSGKKIVTAGWDRMVRVWDAVSGQPLTPPLPHGRRVLAASFSRDGQALVTNAEDQCLRVWKLTPRESVRTIPLKADETLLGLSADGKAVAIAEKDSVRVQFAATGKPAFAPLKATGNAKQASFTVEGNRLVTANATGVKVWDLDQGTTLHHKKWNKMHAFAVSGDGRFLAQVKANGAGVEFLDLNKNKAFRQPLSFSGDIAQLALSADHRQLATAFADGTTRVWDTATGQQLTPPLEHGEAVSHLAFSPDGRRLATVGTGVRVWETATGLALGPRLHLAGAVAGVQFGADSHLLVATAEGKIHAWDMSPLAGSVKELVSKAELAAGQVVHPASGSLVPLERAAFRKAWALAK